MRIIKIILYLIIFQILTFSETRETLRTTVFYNYHPVIDQEIKSGLEIQRLKGYCLTHKNTGHICKGFIFIPKYYEFESEDEYEPERLKVDAIKKININLSTFKAISYGDVDFKENYPKFNKIDSITLKDYKIRERINKIKKMLLVYDAIEETRVLLNLRIDYFEIPYIERNYDDFGRDFSHYIVIKVGKTKHPYIMNIKNYKPDEVKTEVKNLNQIYQYFKNNPYRDIDYTSDEVDEYEKFIEKNININININEFENILQREIFELTKELDLQ